MYHVYTEKNNSDLTRVFIMETPDFEIAYEKAQEAIKGKEGLNYIIEQTDGSFNSYGDLITTVVARG